MCRNIVIMVFYCYTAAVKRDVFLPFQWMFRKASDIMHHDGFISETAHEAEDGGHLEVNH